MLQPRKQVQSMDLLHIFLDALRFPTQRLPNNSLRRNAGSDNHVVTVSGKHCALAGIVEWGLERDKTIDNLHRPREYFPCPQYSHDISLFFMESEGLLPCSQKRVNGSYHERGQSSPQPDTSFSS
jgi:hypothetical protein